MNTIMVGFGMMPHFHDAVASAHARDSGCLHIVTNQEGFDSAALICDPRALPCAHPILRDTWWWSHVKWLATLWCVERLGLEFPIYCPDWDVLTFGDVSAHLEGYEDYDILHTHEPGQGAGGIPAPLVIHSLPILRGYCTSLAAWPDQPEYRHDPSDMAAWRWFASTHGLRAKNLAIPRAGAVLDANIFIGVGVYEHDGDGKTLHWVDGVPHFKHLPDGTLVKALTLHCWGAYKHRTSSLLTLAGIPPHEHHH